METCYCSILEHRLVDRGFLYGPICPIYGAGVLLMVLFFTPLKHNLFVFYLTAVVVMTSWEYFVAWLLETTTHVRYWDYSRFRFNIKGRVCLWVALVWGALSYVVIDEAQVQFSLGKAELGQMLENQSAALRSNYSQQVARLERYSRSFRRKYSNMRLTSRYASLSDDLRASAAAARKEFLKKRENRKKKK